MSPVQLEPWQRWSLDSGLCPNLVFQLRNVVLLHLFLQGDFLAYDALYTVMHLVSCLLFSDGNAHSCHGLRSTFVPSVAVPWSRHQNVVKVAVHEQASLLFHQLKFFTSYVFTNLPLL